jgi:hypothetical protein
MFTLLRFALPCDTPQKRAAILVVVLPVKYSVFKDRTSSAPEHLCPAEQAVNQLSDQSKLLIGSGKLISGFSYVLMSGGPG